MRVKSNKSSFVVQESVNCVDFYGPYLILGTDTGLIVGDAMDPNFEYFGFVIPKVQFKDLFIIEELGVMMAICGRSQHLRQYKLSTLKRLIRYGMTGDAQYLKSSESLDQKTESTTKWTNIFNKSENGYFIKIPNSRDTTMIKLSKTGTSAFVGMTNKSMLTVLEWAKSPYNRFMKTKSFWLPESPRFFCLINNGKMITKIIMGYHHESNSIDFESSKVSDILVNSTVSRQSKKGKWVDFDQLPLDLELLNDTQIEQRDNIKMQAVMQHKKGEGLKSVPCLCTFGSISYFADDCGRIVENSQLFEWKSIPNKITIIKDEMLIGYLDHGIEVFDWQGKRISYNGYTDDCAFKSNCLKGKYIVSVSQRKKKECYIDISDKMGYKEA
eukprot:NODE_793_length_4199_cov_0.962195.p2 type:complete len:384 gc:universal NODE_793_length_4199_cov_0.962195:2995-1844(-)